MPEDQGKTPSGTTPEGGAKPEGTPKEVELKVTLDDGTEVPVRVVGDEKLVEKVKGGYLRQADYTKKTQGLSLRERQMEDEINRKVDEKLDNYIQVAEREAGPAPGGNGQAGEPALNVEESGELGKIVKQLVDEVKTLKSQQTGIAQRSAAQEKADFDRKVDAELGRVKDKYPALKDPRVKLNINKEVEILAADLAKDRPECTLAELFEEAGKTVANHIDDMKKGWNEDYRSGKAAGAPPPVSGGRGQAPATPARKFNKDSLDNGELGRAATEYLQQQAAQRE